MFEDKKETIEKSITPYKDETLIQVNNLNPKNNKLIHRDWDFTKYAIFRNLKMEVIEMKPCPWCRSLDFMFWGNDFTKDIFGRNVYISGNICCRRCFSLGPWADLIDDKSILHDYHNYGELCFHRAVNLWNMIGNAPEHLPIELDNGYIT